MRLTAREWGVLIARFGSGSDKTLEQVGAKVGVTRERIRQIQVKALNKAAARVRHVSPVLAGLEAIRTGHERVLLAKDLRHLGVEGSGTATDRLMALLRGLSSTDRASVRSKYPRLTLAVGLVSPPILKDPRVAKIAQARAIARRPLADLTYRDLGVLVLRAHAGPMHWRQIAEEAEAMNRRRSMSRSGFYNALQTSDDLFARVDSGTYALAERGFADVDFYPDVIASVLIAAGKPLTRGRLAQGVSAVREIKRSSLQMFLDMNPRFYRSMEGTYGLRDWLAPRNRQTLRTAAAYVEDPDSVRRIARGNLHSDR